MRASAWVVGLVLGLCGATCTTSSAMAKPPRVAIYEPGQAPRRPVETLAELSLEVGEVSRAAALEALRKKARALGADALTDVRIVHEVRELPVAEAMAVPVVLFGTLVSVLAMSPKPLEEAVAAANSPPARRTARVVRGVAVKYVK